MPENQMVIGLVAVPLLASILGFVCGVRWAKWFGLATAIVQAWFTIHLCTRLIEFGPIRYAVGGWKAPLGIELYADGLSALMILTTTVVGFAVTVYSLGYFASGGQQTETSRSSQKGESGEAFWPVWMILWSALNALFLAGDIFNLYVTLELLTLAGVAMVGLTGKVSSLVAALRYLLTALMGSLFYLLGVALIYSDSGTVDWSLLGEQAATTVPTVVGLSLMVVGLLLKAALFPLHFWLPPAHANAPAPVSALLSSLVLKAPFYILLRFWFFAFPEITNPLAGQLLAGMGAAAVVWGSLQAMRQQRVKLMVAYSTVAQVGYLFLVFGLAIGDAANLAWQAAVYLVLSHACAKAAAFMAAGTLMTATGSDRLEVWSGIGQKLPIPVFAFGLAGASLIGLPPSGGFIAKWLFLNAAVASQHWLFAVVILAGGLLASVYVLRVVACALRNDESDSVGIQLRQVSAVMQWTPMVMALVAIGLGLVAILPLELLEVGSPFTIEVEAKP